MTELEFVCNDVAVRCAIDSGESLLSVLRDRLRVTSVKDGCAPQGQCGCCTVLIDGDARVACVTPAVRVAGRTVTTVEGLAAAERDPLTEALCATGGAQCGFCTPGIVVRAASLAAKRPLDRTALNRALAAHLCRCTGWQTIVEALLPADPTFGAQPRGSRSCAPIGGEGRGLGGRDLAAAARRAELEGGVAQQVGPHVSLGAVGFADDRAPTDALVAVPRPPGSSAPAVEAAGAQFVVAESTHAARALAGKTQGRRSTVSVRPPIELPECPDGGVCLVTSWVEPAYLESDASWCIPGAEPASPLANGGAFGGKAHSRAPEAACALADRFDRPVRVVYSREDVVRLGPKRPPIAGSARLDGMVVRLAFRAAAEVPIAPVTHYGIEIDATSEVVEVVGPAVASMRAPWAETAALIEGALQIGGFDRSGAVDGLASRVLLDTCVASPEGAFGGARVELDGDHIARVEVRVAAGDPLDEVVLRSYCIGAAHMALGWVLTEGLTVDPETGEIHDLTVRSFGVIRAKDVPQIDVTIVDDPREPLPRASDAVFAAVAAATWIALGLPPSWPAREHPVARRLRR
jgi:aerobic-type carbon monoxide dehydrogenase small subunit (CoxS/CutS family)